jgi:uncharacterized membrane protein YidH (DUF202 family)
VNGGAALERTALAWSRSALALAAVGGLALRFALRHPLPAPGVLTAAAALLAAAAMGEHGRRRYRQADPRPSAGLVRAVGVGVGAIGVTATASLLLATAD